MGKEGPNFTTSYVGNFGNFQWLRKSSPIPKNTTTLSRNAINKKVSKFDTDGKLTGNFRTLRKNTNLNRPIRN